MNRFDTNLKMYADAGLRSVEDWEESGREIREGAKPRTDTLYQGKNVSLYGRDQTRQRPGKRRPSPVAEVAIQTGTALPPM